MINLDKHRVDIACPRCSFFTSVSLKQVRIGDVIICRGCKNNIQLIDHQMSTQKGLREIQRSLNRLMDAFSKIGNIKF